MEGLGIALHFANGDSFFAGAGLIIAAAVLLAVRTGRGARLAARLVIFVAAALVAASGTPFPLWVYLSWAATVAWLLVASRGLKTRTSSRWSAAAVIAFTVAVSSWEAWFHVTPVVHVPHGSAVLVIGDSITAGLNDDVRKWHQTFGSRGGYEIQDLAEPGATLESAVLLVRRRVSPGTKAALAILEIGGNDMLESEAPERFESELESLLSEARFRADRVLLMELPIPPFYNEYGAIQRRLAHRHEAILVPKRVFTRVLGARGATLDGLHLSQSGHDMMAREMSAVVVE